ncbi:MAG: STAS domain-containing protein [Roseobacter sp.]
MTDALVLAPKLDLAAASALMTTLRENDKDDMIVDMSEVKHLGALCLQVLLSAASTAHSQNRKFSITKVSDRAMEQMRVMGMTPESLERGRQ